jgi:hypothetical protein
MASWKSVLKPEGSIGVALATVGAVYGVYSLNIGSVAQAQASDANHPVLEASRKKAGYTALALVGGLFLITRDANVATLGGFTIIAMELSARHAIMADPKSGVMQNPSPASAFESAVSVPAAQQGETG